MTNRQSNAAIGLFLFALGLVILFLSWLGIEIIWLGVRGDEGAGRLALLLFQNDATHLILKGVVAILGLGCAYVARPAQRDALAYVVIGAAALGAIECIIVLVSFADYKIAQDLYDFPGGSSITSYEELQSHTRIAMGGVAAWLLGIIWTQLGRGEGGAPADVGT